MDCATETAAAGGGGAGVQAIAVEASRSQINFMRIKLRGCAFQCIFIHIKYSLKAITHIQHFSVA